MAAAPSLATAQGPWPQAVGLFGAAAMHGVLLALILGWRVPPAEAPAPIVVELVAIPPPMPDLPMLEAPPLPEFETAAPPEPAKEAVVEPEPPPAPTASTRPPRPKPKPAPRPSTPSAAEPSAPAAADTSTATAAPTPAPAPALAPTPLPAAAPAVEDAAYLAALLRHLEQHRDYPRSARLRRIEGRALVQLALARDGRLLDARIERSAGHEMLDAAAIDSVRRAAPLPPVPAALPGERVILRVPFIYRLNATPGNAAPE